MTDILPLHDPLPPEVLARITALPVKPESLTLTGRFVELRPLDVERDAEALYRISNGEPLTLGERHIQSYDADALIWRFMLGGPFADLEAMKAYLRGNDGPAALPFTVVDRALDHPVGVATYMNSIPAHLKIELGSIWYSPIAQRTPANTEATYLMLRHAFDLGYRRVEWKCNALNERSMRAALRMGFQFEGIQESHFIIKGRNRDTAWYRILDREWPGVQAHLEKLLYSEP
ncbi:MAG TPA: GNAT family protein [Aggregatilineales bacterium]|nr:GNAT family protein [Aggregatilineales bacterium]